MVRAAGFIIISLFLCLSSTHINIVCAKNIYCCYRECLDLRYLAPFTTSLFHVSVTPLYIVYGITRSYNATSRFETMDHNVGKMVIGHELVVEKRATGGTVV